MTKKIGIALASLAVIVLITASGYALAGEKTSSASGAKKASTTETTVKADVKTAENTTAKSGCSATCASACTSKGAKASGTTNSSAVNAVGSTCSVSCTGAKDASGKATCTEAEKAACKAAGYDCSTHGAKSASAMNTASTVTVSSSEKSAAGCSEAEKAACASSGKSCSASCSSGASKASYAANVYKVENGMMYAVADGKRFVVTSKTPYTQVGNARYYFADEACKVGCPTKMSSMTSNYNAEAAHLATHEANVTIVDGKKMATCCSSTPFEVSANTPSLVVNGEKVYYCSEKCADQRMAMAN